MGDKSSLEANFDVTFTAILAQREKQIQQSYRPIIGVHKWFARRPGSVFRSLLLSEFNSEDFLEKSYWRAHDLKGVVADPFMGGGTTIYEANRLGFSVVGTDINPMAFWIVRQSLASLDLDAFAEAARAVISGVEKEIGDYYTTVCDACGESVPVKYFIWVKTLPCPVCRAENDLFPGYLLAEAVRHPRNVVACGHCGQLNECDRHPTPADPEPCRECGRPVFVQGVARGNRIVCRQCKTPYAYPPRKPSGPPRHRMWAMEYHCHCCKPSHAGRFFKRPSAEDLCKVDDAAGRFKRIGPGLPIPDEAIPVGDETRRLHRWGYTGFREMFNERQLLGLGLLLRRIMTEEAREVRHALLTVFSDFLRYQNMLCRYDTYALKCQDIFSVHGFPVGLVQCENSILGIPRVGSGSFRHFVEKYLRAKQYCLAPFETRIIGRRKEVVPVVGERIEAKFVKTFPRGDCREALVEAASATEMPLPPDSLDGVFTDPPYFDNVQYAELMDFCFAWLRLGLGTEFPVFEKSTTRAHAELTGNESMGRGLDHFTEGLSRVFRHYAAALKIGAPFVFTYHHNDPEAYVPLVVAILDAGLDCSATLPAPAEMGASLHIARTKSSVLDSVFVCRKRIGEADGIGVEERLRRDLEALAAAGIKVTEGDIRCLSAGHIARVGINRLRATWDPELPLGRRMLNAREVLNRAGYEIRVERLVMRLLKDVQTSVKSGDARHAAAL
jgi:adenine-specific DNA methylase